MLSRTACDEMPRCEEGNVAPAQDVWLRHRSRCSLVGCLGKSSFLEIFWLDDWQGVPGFVLQSATTLRDLETATFDAHLRAMEARQMQWETWLALRRRWQKQNKTARTRTITRGDYDDQAVTTGKRTELAENESFLWSAGSVGLRD